MDTSEDKSDISDKIADKATLEESSRYELEIQLLKSQNEHLITELQSWKSMQQSQGLQHGHHSQQQQPALQTAAGESVLVHPGQMLSSLARKVAQLGTSDSQQPNQALVDNLEESMRKFRGFKIVASVPVCDMCLNYEEQLVQSQKKVSELEKQLVNVERYKEQLAKETVFRKEMEEKFSESKEEHKNQMNCKHCGRIFCLACLQHKITSGPNQRESRVCQLRPSTRGWQGTPGTTWVVGRRADAWNRGLLYFSSLLKMYISR
ncbi:unnamed protein product [Nesidiocoris tenuis]|uniref:Uncharacterized protein n=1 Tax=Nesidiocoris tenuis TaxID=355587 RepID=A0A6H5HBC8_9HEMI|nr:unnamed protein product [Nesidiocoris tenuis]